MRCIQVLSSLALKRLLHGAAQGRNRNSAVAALQFPQSDHHVARALRQANARAWVAVEVLLGGEPLWERAQLTWERSLETEFFQPLRFLLDDIALAPLDESGPDARRKACQSLQAALGSGLLTSGTLELTELLPDAQQDDEAPEDYQAPWRILAQLTTQLEQAGYAELSPFFQLRCGTGEPFLPSMVASFFRQAVEADPDLFGGFGTALTKKTKDLALEDLRPVAVMLDRQRARLDSLLGGLRDAGAVPMAAPPIDTLAGANRLEGGMAFAQRGDYEKAIGEYTAALQLDPASVQAFLYRGDAYRLKGDYGQALADYSTALRQDPGNAQALMQRGQVHWIMGHAEEALADFTEVLQIDPKSAVAYHYRGKALAATGDLDGAVVNFSEALRIDPYYAWVYHDSGEAYAAKGRYERAIADFSEAIRLNPLTTLTYLRRGDAYAAQKDYDRAIADYGSALRLDPHNVAGYQKRGVAYREQGKYDQAAAELTRALELDFSNGSLYFERGRLLQLQGNHARALLDFNAAVARNVEEAEVYYRRGLTHQVLDKAKQALADFSQAIRLDPDYVEAYHTRGQLYATRGELDLALPDFRSTLRLKPTFTQAYVSRAQALITGGQFDLALKDCNTAIAKEPELTQAYFLRGNVLAQKGEFAPAIEDFTRALRADPANAQAFYLRGVAYLKLENPKQAVVDLSEAIRLDPDHARAYAQRAAIRHAAGLVELALSDLAHAARLDAQLVPAYCRQLGAVHTAKGQYECAVADFTVALVLDPDNTSAQAGREQAWKAYLTQPKKKPATGRGVQQLGGKFPVLLEGGNRVPASEAGRSPKAAEPGQSVKETAAIKSKDTRQHPAMGTGEVAAVSGQETAHDMSMPEEQVAGDQDTTFEINDPSIEQVTEGDGSAAPEHVTADQPEQSAEDAATAEFTIDVSAAEESQAAAEQKAEENRKRMAEEVRKAEEQRKADEVKRLAAEKFLASKKSAKKTKKFNDDDDDDGRLPLWKKGVMVAASVFAVIWLGSTGWGFVRSIGATNKWTTLPLSGTLVTEANEPLGKVRLTFTPKDPPGIPAYATTKDDGTFVVGTYTKEDGIIKGRYMVTLEPTANGRGTLPFDSKDLDPVEIKSDGPTDLPLKLKM